jgi:hypothetical protein
LEPVFYAVIENATRICEAKFGVLELCDDGGFRLTLGQNLPPAYVDARKRESNRLSGARRRGKPRIVHRVVLLSCDALLLATGGAFCDES